MIVIFNVEFVQMGKNIVPRWLPLRLSRKEHDGFIIKYNYYKKQTRSFECGYYVMQWMSAIIQGNYESGWAEVIY